MSAANRNNNKTLSRPRRKLPQRKLFVIVGEGELTEQEYIGLFSASGTYTIAYTPPRGHHGGDAKSLVKEMRRQKGNHAQSTKPAPTEYWIIADAEEENKNHNLQPLFDWVQEDENNHLAITYPQFENWLLLHYQPNMGSTNPVRDLAKHIPGYGKHKKSIGKYVTDEQIRIALQNAKSAGVEVTDRPSSMTEIAQGRAYYTSVPCLVRRLI
ncbi:RloB family protein [uncultured Bifidobacterium sp.]|uniref:RloB family protein n=1 Tax=uncultured Bifidobacterium sp. TaxID=165187 RepID=UPI00259586F4|nr:RloB family protein [uncultured Bifidobacterium sp.]